MKLSLFLLFSILFIGCSPTHYFTYEAKPSKDTNTFYSNGIPITSYKNNQEFLLFTTQETSLDSKKYLRVWLLLQNNSDLPYLLEPYNIIEIIGTDGVETFTFKPQSPTKILDNIEAEKNASMILTSIGGALKAMTTEGTKIKDNNGNEYKINDKEEKRDRVIELTNNDLNNTANWYNLFENSLNAGVLRKNTLFPHNSINGYIYFPLGDKFENSLSIAQYNINDFKFEIKLKLNNTIKIIELSPVSVW